MGWTLCLHRACEALWRCEDAAEPQFHAAGLEFFPKENMALIKVATGNKDNKDTSSVWRGNKDGMNQELTVHQ